MINVYPPPALFLMRQLLLGHSFSRLCPSMEGPWWLGICVSCDLYVMPKGVEEATTGSAGSLLRSVERPQLSILLADDRNQWMTHGLQAPTAPAQDIAATAALSSAARGRRQGLPTRAASVASTVLHAIRTAVSREWQRMVVGDPALLASGICCFC